MIKMLLSKELTKALKANKVKPEEYGAAYDGESAGLDLYYVGENPLYVSKQGQVADYVFGQEVRLVSTGLRVAIPKGYVGLILDRGSISKTHILRRAGVIDPGYTGEVFVNLVGLPTGHEYFIYPNDKLPVQLVVVPFINAYEQVTEKEFVELTSASKRKEGKTGSSDTKKE